MPQEIYAALPAIYDAVTSEEHWPRALDAIAAATGARGTILMAYDVVGMPFQVQTWCTHYKDEDIAHYFRAFGRYEQSAVKLLEEKPARTLQLDIDAWPNQDEVAGREDYVFLRERYGVEHRAVVRLSKDRGWTDTLAVQVDRHWPEVPSRFWSNLDLLLPHLAKVVEVNRTFTLLRLRYQAVLTALDRIGFGVCVALRNGMVLVANEEAHRIFSAKDGLRLGRDGRLSAKDEDVTSAIHAAISMTAGTARGDGDSSERSVSCPRTSTATPYLIEISPLRDGRAELEPGLAASLVIIVDVDRTQDVSSEGIARLFGLSPTEKEVCAGLMKGLTVREIAEMRNVSAETVKAQAKALYAKTGVANRAELVRVALTAEPPIK